MSFTDLLAKAVEGPVRGSPLRYVYYQDLGTALDDAHDTAALEKTLVEYNDWCEQHIKGKWRVSLESHNVVVEVSGRLTDVRYWLVLSFDLSGDAMLSRMTWPDLRRYPDDAERRGRTGEAS